MSTNVNTGNESAWKGLPPLQWRHNGCDGASHHRRLGCLLNRLFRCRSKKISKLRVSGLCHKRPVSRKIFLFYDIIMSTWPSDALWCCRSRSTVVQVMADMMASLITDVSIVYSPVCSGADQRKHQSSASLAFVWGIHRWPVNSPHKGPVTRKMFPFHDVIMCTSLSLDELPCKCQTSFMYVVRRGLWNQKPWLS